MEWVKEKPVLDRECVLLAGCFNMYGQFDPEAYTIKKIKSEPPEDWIPDLDKGESWDDTFYYWGIVDSCGEEWGDYAEFNAEYYMIIDLPSKAIPERHS